MVHINSYYVRHRDERLKYQKIYRNRLKQNRDLLDMKVVEDIPVIEPVIPKVKVKYTKTNFSEPFLMTFY